MCVCVLPEILYIYQISHLPSDIIINMDIQTTTTSSVYVMPFTQLVISMVALCCLVKVIVKAVKNHHHNQQSSKFQCSADGSVVGRRAPSPRAWPILGNLPAMAGYDLPYQSFGALGKRFGSIIGLRLGNQPAMVVNGIENIKEVLIGKTAHQFDSRPNFKRYHDLFSGNKDNCK